MTRAASIDAARRVGGAVVHTVSESARQVRHPGASWRRWIDEFDPWAPRPGDYVVAAAVFLLLALAYVGERSHAVQLDRRIYQLEERRSTLRTRVELLSARVTALADRRRVVSMAREDLGMTMPGSDAIEYIYFVADGAASSSRRSATVERLP